jgi:hypothetical protein
MEHHSSAHMPVPPLPTLTSSPSLASDAFSVLTSACSAATCSLLPLGLACSAATFSRSLSLARCRSLAWESDFFCGTAAGGGRVVSASAGSGPGVQHMLR